MVRSSDHAGIFEPSIIMPARLVVELSIFEDRFDDVFRLPSHHEESHDVARLKLSGALEKCQWYLSNYGNI